MKKIFSIFVLIAIILTNAPKLGFARETPPGSISDLSAASDVGAIYLSWSAPFALPAVSDYLIYYRQYGSSAWTLYDDGESDLTSITIPGLTNGTYYEFDVRGVNDFGIGTRSNAAYSVPLPQTFADDFESYAESSDINGQSGWVQGGTSVYTVQSVDGTKALGPSSGSDCTNTNYVSHAIDGSTAVNMRIKFDYYNVANGQNAAPSVWLRQQGTTGDAGGYAVFKSSSGQVYLQKQPPAGGCALYTIASSSALDQTINTWYTEEVEAVTLPNGGVQINVYVYPKGGTRDLPVLTTVDANSDKFLNGVFGFGRFGTNAIYYDNVQVYSQAVLPQLEPMASNVAIFGNAEIGSTVTGTYDYYDVNGDVEGTSIYRWLYRNEDETTTPIPGATGSTYVIKESDTNRTILFEVTPVSVTAPTTGSPVVVENPIGPFVNPNEWHFIITGQSLATGYGASPALSTGSFSPVMMLDGGVESTGTSLVPLYEAGLGENGDVETPAMGIAQTFYNDDFGSHKLIFSTAAHNGTAYSGLKKGSLYYTKALQQAANVKAAVEGISDVYKPKAIIVYHGESDYLAGLASTYEANLVEWQNDYKTDLNALAGTTETIPMFINQTNTQATGEIADAQLSAHKNNPGKIILVGPKYQFMYDPVDFHLTNRGSRASGELMAKVMAKVLSNGETWNPLMPTNISRNANVITVSFNIPEPPLEFDTSLVAQRENYGFKFVQTGGNAVSISNVELIDSGTKVKITLSGTPTGTDQKLQYAWSCPTGMTFCAGADDPQKVGGNVRDSDAYVSQAFDSSNETLYNWLVAFSQPVTDNTPAAPSSGGGRSSSGTTSGFIKNLLAQGVIDPKNAAVSPDPVVKPQPAACVEYLPSHVILSRARINDRSLVVKLQQFLKDKGFDATIPLTGNFLSRTETAVKKLQMLYASDILAPLGLSQPTGIAARMTIGKINSLVCNQ